MELPFRSQLRSEALTTMSAVTGPSEHLITPAYFNERGTELLPGHVGVVITHVSKSEVRAELQVRPALMAINGFLHAASVVTLADTSAGYGCVVNLPESASGFTTIELKSNHLGTARNGVVECIAKPLHVGRTTQVWDAVVTHRESQKTIAVFRCTQMVLYAR